MKIAISGAGVAGPALAYWLLRSGHEPTLIERAPHFRTGGYVIDFWGVGYTVAERMGILREVRDAGYIVRELRIEDENGHRVGGFRTDVVQRYTDGRFTSLPRGDLAATIYSAIEDRVEAIFGNSISAIEESASGVRVELEHGPPRDFDMVVGADGLHSRVRRLAFGPEERFEKQLGYHVASFAVDGYRPRDELEYVAHASPGRQLSRFALRGDRTMFLFVFRSELMPGPEPRDVSETRAVLRSVFGDMGWESGRILEALDGVSDIYFDRVSQIRMESWSKGRVILLGDAACAVSLLAGEGTGLAMTEAYVLAGELHRAKGDHRAAFESYETLLRPFVEGKQEGAEGFAKSFVPATELGVWVRDRATKLLGLPMIGEWMVGRSINVRDDLELPEYGM